MYLVCYILTVTRPPQPNANVSAQNHDNSVKLETILNQNQPLVAISILQKAEIRQLSKSHFGHRCTSRTPRTHTLVHMRSLGINSASLHSDCTKNPNRRSEKPPAHLRGPCNAGSPTSRPDHSLHRRRPHRDDHDRPGCQHRPGAWKTRLQRTLCTVALSVFNELSTSRVDSLGSFVIVSSTLPTNTGIPVDRGRPGETPLRTVNDPAPISEIQRCRVPRDGPEAPPNTRRSPSRNRSADLPSPRPVNTHARNCVFPKSMTCSGNHGPAA